ncbi:hypothetical protein HMPREF9318_02050 [Streptococcus urinalis FB127-CNA-2]|uniref:Gram positive anchor n=1 Tax=Streptococcus urinalis 2285-97 TaxID=764291 RepID=G5KCI7_9STRE|nr:hypothetical protein [Streptococcus urinalis]EHJ57120.1 hypothetical protein STRUR_1726 [Streptococcus urinalis 2285-97]EKS17173.1 hypothetical protein HMPREF9318_02050 [Streptococcus urinalis FB127-CNA-2]VEF32577.1 Uncharacterised protein [Streptococcus urinalis]
MSNRSLVIKISLFLSLAIFTHQGVYADTSLSPSVTQTTTISSQVSSSSNQTQPSISNSSDYGKEISRKQDASGNVVVTYQKNDGSSLYVTYHTDGSVSTFTASGIGIFIPTTSFEINTSSTSSSVSLSSEETQSSMSSTRPSSSQMSSRLNSSNQSKSNPNSELLSSSSIEKKTTSKFPSTGEESPTILIFAGYMSLMVVLLSCILRYQKG